MAPPLTREADLTDQKLQRWGGQFIGTVLAALGGAGVVAWWLLAAGQLPLVALGPPVALILAGAALVVWSRGIDALPDPGLPAFAELPDADPRHRQPLSLRRARWIWCASLWIAGMCIFSTLAWLSKGQVPGWIRLLVFLFATTTPTLLTARWLERTNGESGWPGR